MSSCKMNQEEAMFYPVQFNESHSKIQRLEEENTTCLAFGSTIPKRPFQSNSFRSGTPLQETPSPRSIMETVEFLDGNKIEKLGQHLLCQNSLYRSDSESSLLDAELMALDLTLPHTTPVNMDSDEYLNRPSDPVARLLLSQR